MAHGDPKHPKKNPHPVQRYEIVATADAPGPWDSVSGTAFFDVVNAACTPKDEYLGVHAKPQDVPIDFEMTRVSPNTWKGYFYRDAILDEDYYGLGVCHWGATSVTAVFKVRGGVFVSSGVLDSLLNGHVERAYFEKANYGSSEIVRYGPQSYSGADADVARQPDKYFSIEMSVKETTR